MEANSQLIKSVLRFVSGESEDICRLCLAPTNSEPISLADTAAFDTPYYEGFATYEDMLDDLGVPYEELMPLQLCSKCAEHITETYLFKKLSRYTSEIWKDILLKTNTALDRLIEPKDSTEMVCLIMGESENHYFTSSKLPKNKREVVNKVKSYISQKKFKKKANKIVDPISAKFDQPFSSDLLSTKTNRRENQFPCQECPRVFKSDWSLKDHKEKVHCPKNIQCPKCAKMVSTERLLRIHDDQEHVAATCKECFMQFPSKMKLQAHMNKHGVYKCNSCERIFTNKLSHKSHIRGCGLLIPRLICDICNVSYKFKTALRTHMKVVHGFGVISHPCPWCGKNFDVKSRLKVHLVKHTRERNFHCDKCGGMFVTQPALTYHMRLHTGERPFKCDLCPERFLSASRRMEHKRRKHFGPQKECPYCDRKFVTKFCANKHIERHLNPQSRLFIGYGEKTTQPKIIRKVVVSV